MGVRPLTSHALLLGFDNLPAEPLGIYRRGIDSEFSIQDRLVLTRPGKIKSSPSPSAPRRSEEAHRVGASRRARLSRDGLTLTRRRPSRREMRACGASSRKRPRRPGVVQAVADGVNYPRGFTSTPEADRPQHPLPGYYARPTAWRNPYPVRLDRCRLSCIYLPALSLESGSV